MIRKLFFFFSLFFLALLLPSQSYADTNFNTSFDITYTVRNSGTAHAVFTGTLENLTDNFYAPSYSLLVGFTDIRNIQAFDSGGSIAPSVGTQQNGKMITLVFNGRNIGIHKTTHVTFSFDTDQLASHVGSIWEVNIPGIANQADFKNFTVHLSVPDSFGRPSITKPSVLGSSLDFDKNTLGSSGIALSFGTQQVYTFSLDYHIKNGTIFPATTNIALPPDTNYQTVSITDISPKPSNVLQDQDGNWLAQYILLPSQRLTVTAKGVIDVTPLSSTSEALSEHLRQIYTQKQPFWQTDSSDIQKLAKDLKTPDAIYEYVSHELSYDFSRVAGIQKRVGAEGVVKNPTSAVCLEFTDLFIAIARAAGIPSREVDGYAYTQNTTQRPLLLTKDILHTWPEYYDDIQKKWIMVDPTWANTTHGTDFFHTFDFDHVAFVVKGISSTSPIPAGGYKFDTTARNKDVTMGFTDSLFSEEPKISLQFDIKKAMVSGLPIDGNLIITNEGSVLVSPLTLTVSSTNLTPTKQEFITDPIPPFGHTNIAVHFDQTSLLTNTHALITIQVAGQTLTKTITIQSFLFQTKYVVITGGLISAGIFVIGLYILTAKARRIHLQK